MRYDSGSRSSCARDRTDLERRAARRGRASLPPESVARSSGGSSARTARELGGDEADFATAIAVGGIARADGWRLDADGDGSCRGASAYLSDDASPRSSAAIRARRWAGSSRRRHGVAGGRRLPCHRRYSWQRQRAIALRLGRFIRAKRAPVMLPSGCPTCAWLRAAGAVGVRPTAGTVGSRHRLLRLRVRWLLTPTVPLPAVGRDRAGRRDLPRAVPPTCADRWRHAAFSLGVGRARSTRSSHRDHAPAHGTRPRAFLLTFQRRFVQAAAKLRAARCSCSTHSRRSRRPRAQVAETLEHARWCARRPASPPTPHARPAISRTAPGTVAIRAVPHPRAFATFTPAPARLICEKVYPTPGTVCSAR